MEQRVAVLAECALRRSVSIRIRLVLGGLQRFHDHLGMADDVVMDQGIDLFGLRFVQGRLGLCRRHRGKRCCHHGE